MTPVEARFWAKVDKTGECWLWTGARDRRGYGSVGIDGRTRIAYRVAYEWLVGAIPAGLELDHLCRNPSCVNPAHLQPVTHRENILRGAAPSAVNARKTQCAHGHPLSGGNLIVEDAGHRRCRRCLVAKETARQKRRQQSPVYQAQERARWQRRKLDPAYQEAERARWQRRKAQARKADSCA